MIQSNVRYENLREQIDHALEFPYSQKAVNLFEYKEKLLISQFLEGMISRNELWGKLSELEETQPPIVMSNVEELRQVLGYMNIAPDEAKRISNDLLFGYWKAEFLHLPTRIILKIYKTNDMMAFFVAIQINLEDDTIDNQKAKQYLKDI